jgi:hypothetical protein
MKIDKRYIFQYNTCVHGNDGKSCLLASIRHSRDRMTSECVHESKRIFALCHSRASDSFP